MTLENLIGYTVTLQTLKAVWWYAEWTV